MSKLLFILLVFLLHAIGKEQRVFTYSGKQFYFQLYVTKELSDYNPFYEASVDSIIILEKHTHKYIQTIVCEDNIYDCKPTDSPRFYVEDMNFDNYEDFRLMEMQSAGSTAPYYYWLYNPNTMKFEPSNALEDIADPKFDQKNKSINSYWKTSPSLHGTTTYKYKNGIPEIAEETDVEVTEENTIITKRKMVEGELKVVSKKEIGNESE
jgi:hypothetical protein